MEYRWGAEDFDLSLQGRRYIYAGVWLFATCILFSRGLPYLGLLPGDVEVTLEGTDRWLALAIALVIGLLKGSTVLRKSGLKAVTRMKAQGEHAPAHTIMNIPTVALIAVMVAMGIAIRTTDYDTTVKARVIGILYPAIGLALLIGARAIAFGTPPEAVTADTDAGAPTDSSHAS